MKSILLCVLIGLTLSLHAWYSASKSLEHFLEQKLPALTTSSLNNSVNDRAELTRISNYLLKRLNQIDMSATSSLSLLERLEVTEFKLIKNAKSHKHNTDFSWVFGEHMISLQFETKPHFKLFNIFILAVLLTLIAVVINHFTNKVIHFIEVYLAQKKTSSPEPATKLENSPLHELLNNHTQLSSNEIDTLCENNTVKQLTSLQLQWLIVAINNQLNTEAAINIAITPDSIQFDLANQQVYIHGLAIRLAKTPLFYYYWYAQREVNKLSPYINPPPNKPDTQSGAQLAQLMIEFKGHQKAIRDLQKEGLKGKTLDQNRNKIKAELHKVIGELAENYLFISERDIKTARYKYQLNSLDKKIIL